MPIYEYRCRDCDNVFEEWHRGYEEKEITCPQCNGVARRLISNTAFILKGSGWYVTDYARNQDSDSGNGNGDGKSQEQTASSTEGSEAAKEQASSQPGGESAGGNGSGGTSASGEKEKSSSKSEAGTKPAGQTPPSNSSTD
jgi:putative FmdB family regulatory protein